MYQQRRFEGPALLSTALLCSLTLINIGTPAAAQAPSKTTTKPSASTKKTTTPAAKPAAKPTAKPSAKPTAAKPAATPKPTAAKPAPKPAPKPVVVKSGPAPTGYTIYSRAPFSPIRPETRPAASEALPSPRLSVFMCADEVEPATFAVYAKQDLRDVTVTLASEFLSESRQFRLPADAVSVHVVKPLTTAATANGVVPELLLKDDRVPLVGPAPDVRLTGDPQTDIPTGTSKQFWVTVRVPAKQLPSTYTGMLLLSARGLPATSIPLQIDVLPMRLRTAFLQYGMDFRSLLSQETAQPGQPVVTQEVFTRQLENIRSHGFRFVSLYDPVVTLPDAFRIYKQAGLSQLGPIVIMSPLSRKSEVENIEKLRGEVGLSPDFNIYYGVPTPVSETVLDPIKERFSLAHEATQRAKTLAPITERQSLNVLGQSLNVPVYSVYSDYAQQLVTTGKREIGGYERDWWSWSISQESPVMNRLYAGFLLYRTGSAPGSSPLYGAFPGPYQYAPGGDPFTGTVASAEGAAAPRPQMATYPAKDGVIDTLQWEAAREGIDDVRYIGNLMTYRREVLDLKIRKDATDASEAYFRKAINQQLTTLSPGQIQEMRRGIANEALNLLTILRGNSRTYPD